MAVIFKHLRRAVLSLLATGIIVLALTAQFPRQAQAQEADILSIGGTVTEIIYALGQGKRLIARDTTSTWPLEATKLPDVGYMRALSPEGVLSLAPRMILATEGAGPAETIDVIKAASIQYVTVPEAFSAQGIADKIRVIGAALGVNERANLLADSVLADMNNLPTPNMPSKRVMFVLSLQGGRVMASGTGTGADAAITLAGGTNALSGFTGYKPLSDEAIMAAAPDVIVMMSRGGNHEASPLELFAMPSFSMTPAADNQTLIKIDGLALLGFGPRTPQALRDMSAAIFGD